MNQAVTAVLEREKPGKRGKKRKYNASFTPEDRAAIGCYAAKNGNAAAVKKFKTTNDSGEALWLAILPLALELDRHSLKGVAYPLGNSQSLESQSGLYRAIRNHLTMHSKLGLRYKLTFFKMEAVTNFLG